MVMIKRGFGQYRESQEREAANRGGSFIKMFRLGDDGDKARFRFISSHEYDAAQALGLETTLITGRFISRQATSKNGKQFWTNELCPKKEVAEGVYEGNCSFCHEESCKARSKFVAWVYVDYILHRNQNADAAHPWEPVKTRSGTTIFKETVDDFWVWLGGFYDGQKVEERIESYDTLTDRHYDWVRHGKRGSQQVTYELINGDPSPMPPELIERAKALPSLEDWATGAVRTMDGRPDPEVANGVPPTQTTYRPDTDEPLEDLPF